MQANSLPLPATGARQQLDRFAGQLAAVRQGSPCMAAQEIWPVQSGQPAPALLPLGTQVAVCDSSGSLRLHRVESAHADERTAPEVLTPRYPDTPGLRPKRSSLAWSDCGAYVVLCQQWSTELRVSTFQDVSLLASFEVPFSGGEDMLCKLHVTAHAQRIILAKTDSLDGPRRVQLRVCDVLGDVEAFHILPETYECHISTDGACLALPRDGKGDLIVCSTHSSEQQVISLGPPPQRSDYFCCSDICSSRAGLAVVQRFGGASVVQFLDLHRRVVLHSQQPPGARVGRVSFSSLAQGSGAVALWSLPSTCVSVLSTSQDRLGELLFTAVGQFPVWDPVSGRLLAVTQPSLRTVSILNGASGAVLHQCALLPHDIQRGHFHVYWHPDGQALRGLVMGVDTLRTMQAVCVVLRLS